jgi:hypothetical protein
MSQTSYSQYSAKAFPGQVDGLGDMGVRAMINSALDAKNTWTVTTPATVDNSGTYSISVVGGAIPAAIVASFATDASATQAELTAGLLAAIQASDLSQYFAISSASNVITLEALVPNVAYTVTSPTNATTTNDLTLTQTVSAAGSTAIPFGRFVVRSTSGTVDAFNEARLPTTASNVAVAGVVIAPTHAIERGAVGNTAAAQYAANDVMDVIDRTPPGGGVWVPCDSGSILPTTTAYIDCNTTLGGITATSTSNLALPAGVKIVEPATADPNGGFVVKVALTLA